MRPGWFQPLVLALLLLSSTVSGCASRSERALRIAHRAQMTVSMLQGTQFHHQAFSSAGAANDALYIYIEGDGSPWTHAGSEVAKDPTPIRPLALELATQTPHPVLYLGRPCYFGARQDSACTSDVWASGRYSASVVASMVAAANRFIAAGGFTRSVLIGYSGGGTLAVLMARQIPTSVAVITIAANLDVAAWARWHRYLPLDESLNPATQPVLAGAIRQRYLVAGRDLNVPEQLSRRYLQNVDADSIWRYPEFDHACCWVRQWPAILQRLDAQLMN